MRTAWTLLVAMMASACGGGDAARVDDDAGGAGGGASTGTSAAQVGGGGVGEGGAGGGDGEDEGLGGEWDIDDGAVIIDDGGDDGEGGKGSIGGKPEQDPNCEVPYVGKGGVKTPWAEVVDGRLRYKKDKMGGRLPDFSFAGYRASQVPLPHVKVVETLEPKAGDDTKRIQDAIDAIAEMPVAEGGFRGALLLKKGTYRVSGSIRIVRSGIVVRGEGDGDDGTVVIATGNAKRPLFEVQGGGGFEMVAPKTTITSAKVPVGSRRLEVKDIAGFAVGDEILITRKPKKEWLERIGADGCGSKGSSHDESDEPGVTCMLEPWSIEKGTIDFERQVVAIEGNEIVVDIPFTNAIEEQWSEGIVSHYNDGGRIRRVGIERLQGRSEYTKGKTCTYPTIQGSFECDEDHATSFVEFARVQDGFVRNTTAKHFWWHAYQVDRGSRRITIRDAKYLDPVSRVEGGRRYGFATERSEQILVIDATVDRARHAFTSGPLASLLVYLNAKAERSITESGPHGGWAHGLLFDNVRDSNSLNVRQFARDVPNGGDQSDSDHGWTGVNSVLWNSKAPKIVVHDPPTATNWAIGVEASKRDGGAVWDSFGKSVAPGSLFARQLADRLGTCAARDVLKD